MSTVFDSIVQASWQGAGMVAFVWLLVRVWRGSSPAARSWLWLLAIAKFLLVPLFVIELPLLSPAVVAGFDGGALASVTYNYGPVERSTFDPVAAMLGLWALGAAAILVKAVVDHTALARFVREGAAASERISSIWSEHGACARLLVHPSAQVPLVFGLFRPVVLLPQRLAATFSDEELRMVLAHEAAHLHRRDTFASLYTFACFALFWFHPFVWLARREWQLDREAACDRFAIEKTGASAHDYAAMLLKVSAGVGRTPVLALSAVPTYRTLQRRINDMKKTHNTTRSGKALWALLATLVSAAALPFVLTQRQPNYGAGVFQTKGPDVTVTQSRKGEGTARAVLTPNGVAQTGPMAFPTQAAETTTGSAIAGPVAVAVGPGSPTAAAYPTGQTRPVDGAIATAVSQGYAPTGGVATTAGSAYAGQTRPEGVAQATAPSRTSGQTRAVEEPMKTTGTGVASVSEGAAYVGTTAAPTGGTATAVDIAPAEGGRAPSSVTIVLRDKATGGKGLDAAVSFDVEDVDLVDFLKFLGSTAKVKIKPIGVRSGMRLNADIQGSTLGDVMGTIAKTYKLEWKLEGDGSITVRPFRG